MMRILFTFIFILILVVTGVSSCQSSITYTKYELKANDDFFKNGGYKLPLFSFEYPDFFSYQDFNAIPGRGPNTLFFVASFIYKQPGMPEPDVSIHVLRPGQWGIYNPDDAIRMWVNMENPPLSNPYKDNTMIVDKFRAQYIEQFYDKPSNEIYSSYKSSLRGIAFEYQGLIWTISLFWTYHGDEPPEVNQYFQHVISTFKILDQVPAN